MSLGSSKELRCVTLVHHTPFVCGEFTMLCSKKECKCASRKPCYFLHLTNYCFPGEDFNLCSFVSVTTFCSKRPRKFLSSRSSTFTLRAPTIYASPTICAPTP